MLKWVLVLLVGVIVIAIFAPWLSRRGLGRLPGDITFMWRGQRIYLPITTTLLLSAAATLIGRLI